MMRSNVVPLDHRLEDDAASLWRALADPTRRAILDLLRQRPLITGEIAAQFPISRIAVMRHLEVLSGAGLVTSRKRGRERWHYLNAVPLQELHRRWADPAAAGFASALLRLQDSVEAEGRPMEPIRPTIDIALDIEIAGTPAAVFAALTKDVGGWWGPPFVTTRANSLAMDDRLGAGRALSADRRVPPGRRGRCRHVRPRRGRHRDPAAVLVPGDRRGGYRGSRGDVARVGRACWHPLDGTGRDRDQARD